MAENKEYMIHQEEDGAIQISEDVVASIASTTASEVDGVSAMMSARSHAAKHLWGGCFTVSILLSNNLFDALGTIRQSSPKRRTCRSTDY